MYCEFYIDQFLAEQFLVGILLFALAGTLLKEPLKLWRLLLGSAVNALAQAALLLLGCPLWYGLGLLFGGAALWPCREQKGFLRHFLALSFVTLLFGGVLEAVLELVGISVSAAALASGVVLGKLFRYWRNRLRALPVHTDVTLSWEGRSLTVRAVVDTGNSLTEPLTGRPVSVLEEGVARKLLGEGWEARRGFCLIPYHSVGRDRGMMQGVTLDEMRLGQNGQKTKIRRPVVAICCGRVSAGGGDQMLLHPAHAGGLAGEPGCEEKERAEW